MNTVPIMIGVTGHRSINNSDRSVLYESVQKELRAIQSRCPHTEIKMLNSLAVGADRLCARAALDLKIPLIAVLPFEKERYESDFNEAETAEFRALLKEAEQIITAPASEADEPDGRDAGYRRAGVYLCVHAHALLALWNGEEGKTGECGTADIVACKLHDAFLPKEGTPLSCMHAVICVHTPREGEDGAAGEVRFLGEKEAFDGVLKDTDDFNALCAQTNAAQTPFTEEVSDDPAVKRMEAVYAAADALSMKFAVRYRRILALLAVCSTTVTAAFLLYDEAELHWMIVLCGAALLLCFFLIRFARRSNCHRNYLDNRVLAEGLRVQSFLRIAGSGTEAALLLPWSQRAETPWIGCAIAALNVGASGREKRSILKSWAEEQEAYHLRALQKAETKQRRSERIVRIALIVSICFYAAALFFEPIFGGTFALRAPIADAERYRTLLKLILGSISAATLFISNYYGKLSLDRAADDHKKMADFYKRIKEQLIRFRETDALLSELARAELTENAGWHSYRRDNTPDLDL